MSENTSNNSAIDTAIDASVEAQIATDTSQEAIAAVEDLAVVVEEVANLSELRMGIDNDAFAHLEARISDLELQIIALSGTGDDKNKPASESPPKEESEVSEETAETGVSGEEVAVVESPGPGKNRKFRRL
jgi:hypothetical protein